jgi:hypothetical protein
MNPELIFDIANNDFVLSAVLKTLVQTNIGWVHENAVKLLTHCMTEVLPQNKQSWKVVVRELMAVKGIAPEILQAADIVCDRRRVALTGQDEREDWAIRVLLPAAGIDNRLLALRLAFKKAHKLLLDNEETCELARLIRHSYGQCTEKRVEHFIAVLRDATPCPLVAEALALLS